jgi:hypothetical protein
VPPIGYPIGFLVPDVIVVRDRELSVHRRLGLVRDEVTTIPCRRRRGDGFSGKSWDSTLSSATTLRIHAGRSERRYRRYDTSELSHHDLGPDLSTAS